MTVVTVYTRAACQQCRATERWLDSHDVEYTTAPADDPDNLLAIKALGYAAAPVVIATPRGAGSDVHWYGFNPDMLNRIIEGTL